MKTFKIIMAIAVAIFATTSLIVSLTSPIKSLLDVNVKALTQDEGGTGGTGGTGGIGGIGGGEGSVLLKYGPERPYDIDCPQYHYDFASGTIVTTTYKGYGTYCAHEDSSPCTAKNPCS